MILAPVLLITFNRPKLTLRVLDAVIKAKPSKIYIASDGPRSSVLGEVKLILQLRTDILHRLAGQVEVIPLFQAQHLGCKRAVVSAIDTFFQNEEMGIILEDDCLPTDSFFPFCNELLKHYKNDPSVLHIGGTNPIDKNTTSNEYYFSRYNRIWGWATWRRAWKLYDASIPQWPTWKKEKKLEQFLSKKEAQQFTARLDDVYHGKVDTWDYQWQLIRMLSGKAIIPKTNLVSNIGFGDEATHTKTRHSPLAHLPLGEILFPLQHPIDPCEDSLRDQIWSEIICQDPSWSCSLKYRIKKVLIKMLSIIPAIIRLNPSTPKL